MDIYTGKRIVEFSDIISYLEEFKNKITELEEKSESLEKYIFNLEDKSNDKDYEIERLQKLLDENGISY